MLPPISRYSNIPALRAVIGRGSCLSASIRSPNHRIDLLGPRGYAGQAWQKGNAPFAPRPHAGSTYFAACLFRPLSGHAQDEGGQYGYAKCRQVASEARRAAPDAQEDRPRFAIAQAPCGGGARSASHRRPPRRAKICAQGILRVAPSNLEDPIEREREHAAALGVWFVYFAFVILGLVWFFLFRL